MTLVRRIRDPLTGTPSGRFAALIATAVAILSLFVWLNYVRFDDSGHPVLGETTLYYERATEVVYGVLPYRDFAFEYPPLAIAPIVGPRLFVGSQQDYTTTFHYLLGGLLGMIAAAVVLTSVALRGNAFEAGGAGLLVALGPLSLGDVAASRFDLWPVLLVTLALLAISTRHDGTGGALIGLGAATKVWPAFALPPFLVLAYRRGGKARARSMVLHFAIALTIPFLAAWLLAPENFIDSLALQAGRDLQVESLGASLLIGFSHLGVGGPYEPSSDLGQGIAGGASTAVAAATLPLLLVVVGLIALASVRTVLGASDGKVAARIAVGFALAGVVASMLFSRVLSPQFMLWLLPFPLLLFGVRRWIATLGVVGVLFLTHEELQRYAAYAFEFSPGPTAIVVGRNLMLLALLFVLVLRWRPSEALRRVVTRQYPVPPSPPRSS